MLDSKPRWFAQKDALVPVKVRRVFFYYTTLVGASWAADGPTSTGPARAAASSRRPFWGKGNQKRTKRLVPCRTISTKVVCLVAVLILSLRFLN